MEEGDKSLVWLHGEIKTPPLLAKARLQAGQLLRRLQRGRSLLDDPKTEEGPALPCSSWSSRLRLSPKLDPQVMEEVRRAWPAPGEKTS
jgi:hypothetical protein